MWFSSQVESVTTIEDSGGFVETLKEKLELHNISNVDLRHINKQSNLTGVMESGSKGCCYDNYIKGASDMQTGTLDVVLVDGRAREHCLKEAVRLVKPRGGVLIFDNSNRGRYQEAINTTVPTRWLRHDSNLLNEFNVTLEQYNWIIKDSLFTTFWITR